MGIELANCGSNSGAMRVGIGSALLLSAAWFGPTHAAVSIAQPVSQVERLLADADTAEKTGNINLAIIQLKNAALLQPENGEIRARLGIAFLHGGQAVNAERELRQAQRDFGPPDLVIPGLLSAMLQRNESKQLLQEFPDPPRGIDDKTSPDILMGRAAALQMLGQNKDARAAMDRALSLRHDATTLVASARLAQRQGDVALATIQADQALQLSPDNEAAWTLKISFAGQSGDLKKALAVADDFRHRSPKSVLAKVVHIEVLLALKDDANAKEAVDTLLTEQPKSLYGQYFRAILLSRARDYTGAWRVAQNLPSPFVLSRPGIARTVAAVALASGNVESGGAILSDLVARDPDDRDARLQLATLRLSQKSPQAALTVLEPLKQSDDPALRAVLAQVYLALGRFDDAISSLEVAKSSPRASPELARELALLEIRAGNDNAAIGDLREAVRRDPGNLQLAGSLIGALALAGKSDDALAAADGLAVKVPNSPLPPFYRGQVLIARGDVAGAISEFTKAMAYDQNFAPALYYRASAFAEQGDFEPAKKDLRLLATRDPDNFATWQKLIQIAIQTGQQQDVLTLFDQAIKARPNSPVPRRSFVSYLLAHGKLDAAQTAADELLKIAPDNADAIALKGQIELARGQTVEAVKTFGLLTAEKSPSAGAFDLLARALNAAKDAAGAENAARKAIDVAPNSADARLVLIELQITSGKGDTALTTAREYATANPGADADLLVSYTLLRLKRTNEAEALLDKSLAAHADSRVAWRVSQIAYQLGDVNKAKAVLDDWVRRNPDDFDMRQKDAELLMISGDSAAARSAYDALLKRRPNDPVALNNLANLLHKDDPARALALAVHAAKIAPASAGISDTLGWMKYQRGDQVGSLPVLQHAHELESGNPAISYHYAVALHANGKAAEAKSLLQSVLAKDTRFDGADEARQTLARW